MSVSGAVAHDEVEDAYDLVPSDVYPRISFVPGGVLCQFGSGEIGGCGAGVLRLLNGCVISVKKK